MTVSCLVSRRSSDLDFGLPAIGVFDGLLAETVPKTGAVLVFLLPRSLCAARGDWEARKKPSALTRLVLASILRGAAVSGAAGRPGSLGRFLDTLFEPATCFDFRDCMVLAISQL